MTSKNLVLSEEVAVPGNPKSSGMSPVMDPPDPVVHSAKDGESNGLNSKSEYPLFIPFVSGFQRRLFSFFVIPRAN